MAAAAEVGTGSGTVGHQRFAMDRSSRSDPNESRGSAPSGPPPKASRTEEPPVTGIPMTQLATVSVTNQPERWVYKSGGQTYENDEAWRRFEHDMAAHESLMKAEAQAAIDDDRGVHNDFPVLRPDQRVPPNPPRREDVPQSSISMSFG